MLPVAELTWVNTPERRRRSVAGDGRSELTAAPSIHKVGALVERMLRASWLPDLASSSVELDLRSRVGGTARGTLTRRRSTDFTVWRRGAAGDPPPSGRGLVRRERD